MRKLFLCLFLLPVLCACGGETSVSKELYAMDTVMSLKLSGPRAEAAMKEAQQLIWNIDRQLDRGEPDSEIMKINQSGGSAIAVPPELADLIKQGLQLSEWTGGAFDMTIAPVMDLWGFYGQQYQVPEVETLKQALEKVGPDRVRVEGNQVFLRQGSTIDLGGIGKGYLGDRLYQLVKQEGVSSGILSLGGNVVVLGERTKGTPWTVGIQNPWGTGYLCTVQVSDCSVVTSGAYQRFFEEGGKRYHHMIDPATGYPAEKGLSSVTVISGNGVLADGLSTGIFVMGLEKAKAFYKDTGGMLGDSAFDLILAGDDKKLYITPGIARNFSCKGHEYEVIG